MKKIAIIGANSFQNKLILKAKELGYETHVFAWECGDVGEKTADYFYPISIAEKETILKKCREIEIDAICSIASDFAVLTVNYVAREMGLTSNPETCDLIATNKYEMREAFERAGIPTPKHYKITKSNLDKIDFSSLSFPAIVKPTDRSGSRAITRVESIGEIKHAVEAAIEQSFEEAAIVEEFIEGNEFSCECVSFGGKHTLLALTEKFTTGEPHYIEIGHIEPAPISDDKKHEIQRTVFKALDALNIKNGASHTEFRIDAQGNIGIIEIGARMGGDCIGSDLVISSTGVDFVKAVIDVALGNQPTLTPCLEGKDTLIRFIMGPKDLEHLEWAKENLELVEVSDISSMSEKVIDSSSRYGYFIARSADNNKLRTVFS